jgi:hypothetical protein
VVVKWVVRSDGGGRNLGSPFEVFGNRKVEWNLV